ncbi:MAG: general secretion pathway protein GspB [Coxiellaceae bacterium]|nr:general secretion pathway protein GspB [Coxiellaceae bacterium]
MSIIDKALKKTQQDLQSRQVQSTTTEKQATESISQILQNNGKKSRPRKTHFSFLILTTLLLCLLVWQTLQPHHKKNSKQPIAKVNKQLSSAGADPTKALTLSGIMASDGQRIALINSKTYHEGDKIDGAVIVAIQDDKVVLDKNQHVFTLRLSSV